MPLSQPSASSAKPYRDATGATLADYPRPSVAVDTAVLTLAPQTNPPVALPHTGCPYSSSDDPLSSADPSGRYRAPSCTTASG